MCYYESYFRGVLFKDLVLILQGEILVPDDLENYIMRPLLFVRIKSDVHSRGSSDFDLESLESNMVYSFHGEISEIKDGIPVMMVAQP